MTTAATQLEAHLDALWPQLIFQRSNCRPIAGTDTWSQHSWPGGNARDVFGPDMSPSRSSQALLDKVYAHLRYHRYVFKIKVILWRVAGHWDHVHLDPWPTGIGNPPCAGGAERYRYSTGQVVYAKGGLVKPEGKIWMPTTEEPMTLTQARIELASRWHEVSGVWMTADADETAQQRLSRLALAVANKQRSVGEIVAYAPPKAAPGNPVEQLPAWVVDSTLPF